MESEINLLIHDPANVHSDLIRKGLKRCSLYPQIKITVQPAEIAQKLTDSSFDLIIVCDSGGMNGEVLEIYNLVRKHARHIPYVYFANKIPHQKAVEYLKEGILDCIKPSEMGRLCRIVETAPEMRKKKLNQENLKKLQIAVNRKILEEAETKATRGKAYYQHILKGLSAVLISLKPDGRLNYMNPAGQRILKYAYHREEQPNFLDFLMVTEVKENILHRLDCTPSGGAVNCETEIHHSNGVSQIMAWQFNSRRNDDGEILEIIGFGLDMTRQKTVEKQLLQAQKMEALGRLSSGIAHDFNNILTAIEGYAQDISGIRCWDQSWLIHDVDGIHDAVNRAMHLIKRLLTFSREHKVHPEVVNLNDLLSDMVKMLRRLIGAHIQLETKLSPESVNIWADPHQIEQVILNLVVNAGHAMSGGGNLTLETSCVDIVENQEHGWQVLKEKPYVLFSVRDTGCGMSEEVRKHIFEPFFTTSSEGKGNGLGLATCYGIVEKAGGFIQVYSEVSKGTAMNIYFPAFSAQEA